MISNASRACASYFCNEQSCLIRGTPTLSYPVAFVADLAGILILKII